MNSVMTYFTIDRILQIPAIICCLISVYLAARNHIMTFALGIIMAILYVIIDLHVRIYADMSSQIVFIGFQIYGWYQWRQGEPSEPQLTHYASTKVVVISILVAFFVSLIYAFVLKNYTDSTQLPLDISTTALSYSALWLLAKRYVQTWWLWVVINSEAIFLYALKGLYLSSGLYAVLTVLAISGLLQWHQQSRQLSAAASSVKNT